MKQLIWQPIWALRGCFDRTYRKAYKGSRRHHEHSFEGGRLRIELLTAFAFKCGVAPEYIKSIMDSLTTEEALAALKESGRLYEVMDYAMERICFYLDKRAKGRLEIDCIMYSNEFGELAKSRKAEKWFTLLAQEQAQQI